MCGTGAGQEGQRVLQLLHLDKTLVYNAAAISGVISSAEQRQRSLLEENSCEEFSF